jgi:hypothetical protein
MTKSVAEHTLAFYERQCSTTHSIQFGMFLYPGLQIMSKRKSVFGLCFINRLCPYVTVMSFSSRYSEQ